MRSYENKQQEWIENLTSGALIEFNNGKCLCPDTRNSMSNTASLSITPSPLPSLSQTPSVSASRVHPSPASNARSSDNGLALGLGLGIPIALCALVAGAAFGYSLYTGTPLRVLVGKATGGLLGGTSTALKLIGTSTSTAASAGRVSQLGRASTITTESVPDTTSLLHSAPKLASGSGRYGGL